MRSAVQSAYAICAEEQKKLNFYLIKYCVQLSANLMAAAEILIPALFVETGTPAQSATHINITEDR